MTHDDKTFNDRLNDIEQSLFRIEQCVEALCVHSRVSINGNTEEDIDNCRLVTEAPIANLSYISIYDIYAVTGDMPNLSKDRYIRVTQGAALNGEPISIERNGMYRIEPVTHEYVTLIKERDL